MGRQTKRARQIASVVNARRQAMETRAAIDSAAEEAVYLTKYGSRVHLLVRRGELRASKAMQDRVIDNPKITVHWHTEAVDVFGENNRMSGIRVRNRQTGEETDIKAKGLFYAIGHNPLALISVSSPV